MHGVCSFIQSFRVALNTDYLQFPRHHFKHEEHSLGYDVSVCVCVCAHRVTEAHNNMQINQKSMPWKLGV